MERVSTFGLNQALLASAMTVQARLAEKTLQESSSLVATTYGGLGAKSGTLISLESEVTRLNTWSDVTQTALTRVETMYDTTSSMSEALTTLRTTLSSAISDTSDTDNYNATGASLLEEFASLLNLQFEGRYLFAGSLTTTQPVPDDASSYAVPTAPYTTADTSYYSGDDATASVRISENQTIDYGVTADNAAFEKAIRAMSILANLTTDPMDTTAAQAAYDLATEALDGLLAVQGGLSLDADRLETALASQETALASIQDRVTDIKSVDVTEIAVQVTQYETLLQASYSALATISGVSLTDYL